MTELKPLNWTPKPGIGMTVVRRSDGGMTLTFTDMSEATLREWHDFALEHLLGSDRRTRNLYDLRAVKEINEKAVRTAVEVNSDPSARVAVISLLVKRPVTANQRPVRGFVWISRYETLSNEKNAEASAFFPSRSRKWPLAMPATSTGNPQS